MLRHCGNGVLQAGKNQITCDRSNWDGEEKWGHLRAIQELSLGEKPGRRKNEGSGNCFHEWIFK